MDLTQILNQYLKLFEAYFTLCESLDGLDVDVPKMSAYEKSIVATNHINIQDYINSIQLPIYKTEASDILFASIRNIFASTKSIIELNKPYLDPTILSPDLVNNLLRSFGFDFLDLPMIAKRRILTSLVKAYKIKGSINSILEMTKSVITNYNVKEVWLKKSHDIVRGELGNAAIPKEVYFEWESDYIEVPGGRSKVLNKLPYDYVVDKHWWVDYDTVLYSDVSRQMSPFFVVHKTVDSTGLYKGISTFKKKVYDDYKTLTQNPDAYPDRRIITIEALPDSFSHLELWYMIRYFWIYLNYYTFVDDNGRNYFHIDYDFITEDELKQEYVEQFETRYDNKFGEIPRVYDLKLDPIYIHAVISKINDSEVYRYTENRRGYKLVSYQNKIIILFGKDLDGNELNNIRVINPGKPGEETIVHTPFWLTGNYVVFAYGNLVVIYGGEFSDGTENDKVFIIDLDTGQTYISNAKYPTIDYRNSIVDTVYNPYGRMQYIFETRVSYPYRFRLYEQTSIESYPYKVLEYKPTFGRLSPPEIVSYNTNSEVFISLVTFTIDEETELFNRERTFIVYSSTQKKYKVITANDVEPEFRYLFDFSTPIYCFPYGNGFVLMTIDQDNNIRQIFVETNNDVETTILTEYHQYPNNPNYAYKIDPNDYYTLLLANQITTPHSSVIYSIDQVDVFYHIKELKIDKLRYDGKVVDYFCDNNPAARCFRDFMLGLREEKIILDDSVLPKFNTVQELREFLMQITPNNIDSFEKSPYKELILFELLVTASQLTGVDLTSLMSSYLTKIIKEIIERFKPVYSRMIDLTTQMVIADPIGDWLALSDSNYHTIISKHFNEVIALTEYLRLNLEKQLKDNLDITDQYLIQIALDIAINFFDGTIIGELDQTIYLGGQVTEITYGANTITQQYISTYLDTGL